MAFRGLRCCYRARSDRVLDELLPADQRQAGNSLNRARLQCWLRAICDGTPVVNCNDTFVQTVAVHVRRDEERNLVALRQ